MPSPLDPRVAPAVAAAVAEAARRDGVARARVQAATASLIAWQRESVRPLAHTGDRCA